MKCSAFRGRLQGVDHKHLKSHASNISRFCRNSSSSAPVFYTPEAESTKFRVYSISAVPLTFSPANGINIFFRKTARCSNVCLMAFLPTSLWPQRISAASAAGSTAAPSALALAPSQPFSPLPRLGPLAFLPGGSLPGGSLEVQCYSG